MNATLRYVASGVGVLTLATLALWPLLDAPGRRGVLAAALIALSVQGVSFACLLRGRETIEGFLAAWVGGVAVRMLTVGVVAAIVIRAGVEGAVPLLLSLAAFFFGLLLLEPLYFRPVPDATT